MRPNRRGKEVPPGPGGYDVQHVELPGPPVYHADLGPTKSRGPLLPGGAGDDLPPRPGPLATPVGLDPNRLLVPTREEIEKLPRSARVAFAARCARRLEPVPPEPGGPARPYDFNEGRDAVWFEGTAQASVTHAMAGEAGVADRVARLLLTAATVDTPLTRQLRCIRRDFDRLVRLAKEQNWTDDTPVPPTVFGPLWPPGIAPVWAKERRPGAEREVGGTGD